MNAVLGMVDGILTIVPFWGGVDMPSTRDRPAGDPRKTHEGIDGGEILIIGHFFWGGRIWRSKTEPVNQ